MVVVGWQRSRIRILRRNINNYIQPVEISVSFTARKVQRTATISQSIRRKTMTYLP